MYRIFINQELIIPEIISVSAHPFNRTWPGKQRDASQSETAYMVRIYGEGSLDVSVETSSPISDVAIRPQSKQIKFTKESHKISFSLPTNGKYSIEINGTHHAIHLLYQKNTDYRNFPTPTYHYQSGHHYVGLVTLKSGDSVCIEKDAIVHGSFYAVDQSNISIFGDGVICGDWEHRKEKHGDIGFDNENIFDPQDVHTYGGIRMYRCKDISIHSVTVTDTASYAISFFATQNISIENVNVLGLWKYNCDGIDFFNSSNKYVNNCFVRSFDDSMCMKGLTAFSDYNTENVHVQNCVFWCDWGKNIDIGLATACKQIQNILWEDCDIIHNSDISIAISCGQWADVNNIRYRNLHIEYTKGTEKPVYQAHEDDRYQPSEPTTVPTLIRISDRRRTWQGNIASNLEEPKLRDIKFDNIYLHVDKEIDQTPSIIIEKCIERSVFSNIRIQNLFLNGRPLDASKFSIE